MPADILIVGQGIAGSMLAWECERAGFSFEVVDEGDGSCASRVSAGMINPVTGKRFVKSASFEGRRLLAREAYESLSAELGIPLWRDMRVRRLFRDDQERGNFEAKLARGDFGDSVREWDELGFWCEGAACVDTRHLLPALRARLAAQGRFRRERAEITASVSRHALVVDCTGRHIQRNPLFSWVPWRLTKGELLTVCADGLRGNVIINNGQWVLPIGEGRACVGATHEPNFTSEEPSQSARSTLEAAAGLLIKAHFAVTGHESGVRVGTLDKEPVSGRHPRWPALGMLSGLGNKGILSAPTLARQWMNHMSEGVPFEPSLAAERFWPSPG